jgi:microcystin-dependent protein
VLDDVDAAAWRATLGGLDAFVSGTRLLFHQTAAPTGWTKEVGAAFNDVALRLVTGTIGSGGTVAFVTVFSTSRATDAQAPGTSAVAPGSTDGFTLTSAEIPSHTHTQNGHTHAVTVGTGSKGSTTAISYTTTFSGTTTIAAAATSTVATNQNTGGGGSHSHAHATTHSHTVNSHTHNSNLNVQYQDVIIAQKN